MDPTGAPIAGARVKLTREGLSAPAEVLSGEDGQFFFAGIAPGTFQLSVAAAKFSPQSFNGVLHPGESCVVPQLTLAIAPEVTEVSVTMSRIEVAEAEIKEQEKQRALGFIPNFYVSYVSDAAPLTSKQKFELAWKTNFDPVSFVLIGVVAGIQQSLDNFHGYGQGAQGYGKRYGAAYADSFTGNMFSGAIFPSLFRQDPRYFWKGTGSTKSRVLYAIANAVICKSDRGSWQLNYSGIMGSIAAGGISNLYYPPGSRGADLVFENAAVGIGANAVINLFQEFLVRKLTPRLAPRSPSPKHGAGVH